MTLKTKAVCAYVPLAALFLAFVGPAARRGIESVVVEEAAGRLLPPAQDLADALGSRPLRERELLPLLQAKQQELGASSIGVIGPSGRFAAHTNVLLAGARADGRFETRASGEGGPSWERSGTGGQTSIVLAAPILAASRDPLLAPAARERVGTLLVAAPIGAPMRSAGALSREVVLMVAAFCALSLGLALALLQWLLMPLRELLEGTARIAEGSYGAQVAARSSDEVGELAAGFNRMSAALARTAVSRDRFADGLDVARATIEASSEGIIVYDGTGRTLMYNRRFLEMWDATAELVEGGREGLMLHVRKRFADPSAFERRAAEIAQDQRQDYVDVLQLKDGRVYERVVRPILVDGQFRGRVLSFRDMTMLTAGAQAVAQARDEALQANAAKSRFLASMSHELRTPLNAIVGSIELLRAGLLTPVQREHAEVLSKAASTLLDLIRDVLDFSKIEAGRMTLERAPFSLRPILEECAALLRSRAEQKGLLLACEPGPAGDEPLLGDPVRVCQVLMNLLSNAVKFTERGRIRVSIEEEERTGESLSVRLIIEDTGIGIEPEVLNRLFRPFTQADSSMTRRYGGTGLGLAISRSLVELMKGTIGCESAPGSGSRFWVRLRFERADAAAGRAESVKSRDLAGPLPRRDRQRVLIVEDNPVNRRLLLMQIQKLGRPVECASEGGEALELLAREPFGLIFMDCQMPGLDGYETTARIRALEAERSRTPIVALTAHAGAEERERCLAAGMDDYLGKPVTLSALADALDRWDRPFDPIAFRAYVELAASDEDSVERLLRDFQEDAASRLAQAREALRGGDSRALARIAHTLKGSAAALGARGLRELCRRLETAAPQPGAAASFLEQADAELGRLAEGLARR